MDQAPLQSFRLGFGRALAWFFVVVGAAVVVSGVLARDAGAGPRIASALAGVALILMSWVLGIRPLVAEEPDRLLVRNLLRDAEVPWGAVREVDRADVVVVVTDTARIRCFALPRRGRPLLQVQASATMQPTVPAPPPPREPGPPPGDHGGADVAGRLEDLAARLGPSAPGTASVSWSAPAVGAVAAAAVLLVAALLLR